METPSWGWERWWVVLPFSTIHPLQRVSCHRLIIPGCVCVARWFHLSNCYCTTSVTAPWLAPVHSAVYVDLLQKPVWSKAKHFVHWEKLHPNSLLQMIGWWKHLHLCGIHFFIRVSALKKAVVPCYCGLHLAGGTLWPRCHPDFGLFTTYLSVDTVSRPVSLPSSPSRQVLPQGVSRCILGTPTKGPRRPETQAPIVITHDQQWNWTPIE